MSAHNETRVPDVKNLPHYYDQKFAGGYCRTHGARHMGQLAALLLSVPATAPRQTLLDYGCGSGGCTGLIRQYFPESQIHGIDISGEAIIAAATRFPDCHFAAFNGSKAPYPDESFDVIFSSHVLEHVRDLEQALDDIARMLREGGHLCLTLPCANEGSLEERLTVLMENGIIKSATGEEKWFWEDPGHLRRPKSMNLIARISSRGLELKRAFFGNQLWGGFEYICFSGPGFICDLLKVSRARGLRRKIIVGLAKGCLLLHSPVFLVDMNLRQKARSASGVRKVLYVAAMPVKLLYRPLGKLLRVLADKEWERNRAIPNGANQFLVFQKN